MNELSKFDRRRFLQSMIASGISRGCLPIGMAEPIDVPKSFTDQSTLGMDSSRSRIIQAELEATLREAESGFFEQIRKLWETEPWVPTGLREGHLTSEDDNDASASSISTGQEPTPLLGKPGKWDETRLADAVTPSEAGK